MMTGFGESSGAYEESQQQALMGILLPVLGEKYGHGG
jgi:hypothetical protein